MDGGWPLHSLLTNSLLNNSLPASFALLIFPMKITSMLLKRVVPSGQVTCMWTNCILSYFTQFGSNMTSVNHLPTIHINSTPPHLISTPWPSSWTPPEPTLLIINYPFSIHLRMNFLEMKSGLLSHGTHQQPGHTSCTHTVEWVDEHQNCCVHMIESLLSALIRKERQVYYSWVPLRHEVPCNPVGRRCNWCLIGKKIKKGPTDAKWRVNPERDHLERNSKVVLFMRGLQPSFSLQTQRTP